MVTDFPYRKTMPRSVVPQVRVGISTQSYSNFGLGSVRGSRGLDLHGQERHEEERMDVFCGIDWAEDHHDIALADRDGKLLARRRISDDAAGLALLLGLLTEHGDSADDPVPVAIETPRGLLTACLRATGRKVYPINPMA